MWRPSLRGLLTADCGAGRVAGGRTIEAMGFGSDDGAADDRGGRPTLQDDVTWGGTAGTPPRLARPPQQGRTTAEICRGARPCPPSPSLSLSLPLHRHPTNQPATVPGGLLAVYVVFVCKAGAERGSRARPPSRAGRGARNGKGARGGVPSRVIKAPREVPRGLAAVFRARVQRGRGRGAQAHADVAYPNKWRRVFPIGPALARPSGVCWRDRVPLRLAGRRSPRGAGAWVGGGAGRFEGGGGTAFGYSAGRSGACWVGGVVLSRRCRERTALAHRAGSAG